MSPRTVHLVLFGLLAALGPAQGETWVVAAGVERYDDARVASLQFAAADARAVAAAFRAAGVPRANVAVLTSDLRDADRRPTRVAVLTALERVRERAKPGDKLVFFFAGHGVESDGAQYLLTVDTRRSLLADTALPLRLVAKALDGLQAGEVLFLIDACRNDPQAGRADADAKLSDGLARGLRPEFAAPGAQPRVMATLLACDTGQRAWEDPEQSHGAFTVQLLRGLSGLAASPDGQVRLRGLASYVQREVAAWAGRQQRVQTPRLLSADDQDMILLTPPPEPLVSVSFQNHTLAQAVELLAEQYGAQIVLGKGADAGVKVTGRLENQPLSTALKVLLLAHDLSVRREAKVYIIEAKGTTPEPVVVVPPPVVAPQPAADEREPGFDGPVLRVDPSGKTLYRTLSAALAVAPEGATIRLAAGTYPTEPISITQRLAVVGAGPNQTVLQRVGGGDADPLCLVNAPHCAIRGVKFDGGGQPLGGLYTWADDLTVTDCHFTGWLHEAFWANKAGATATLRDCVFVTTTFSAVKVSYESRVVLEACELRGDGSAPTAEQAEWPTEQVLVYAGGSATLRRCRLVGGVGCGLFVESLGSALVEDCQVTGQGWAAVLACSDAGQVVVRNSRLADNRRSALCGIPGVDWFRLDPATGQWKDGDLAKNFPALPQRGRLVVENCDLRSNTAGAFGGGRADLCYPFANTVDPDDKTVPPERLYTPTEADFQGPVLTVAQDGSGQYRTISEAIKAAPEGATIRIGAGIYREHLWTDKRLALVASGRPGQTVVDSSANDVALYVEKTQVLVRGLSFKLSYRPANGPSYTASVGLQLARVRFIDCQFTAPAGTGATVLGGAVRLERCQTTDCWFWGWQFAQGALAEVVESSSATCASHVYSVTEAVVALERSTFRGGSASPGVGVFVDSGGALRMRDCEITGQAKEAIQCSGAYGVVDIANSRLIANSGAAVSTRDYFCYGRRQPNEPWLASSDNPNLPAQPPQATPVIRDCDLRGNKGGAFSLAPGRPVAQSHNTVDPEDQTVPK